MKRGILLGLILLLVISSCRNIVFEETEEKTIEPTIVDIKKSDCCIGCGVNECQKAACPYECCIGDIFENLNCNQEDVCIDNKCINQEQAQIEGGLRIQKDDDVGTFVYVDPFELKAGEYLEVIIIPGNEGYVRRINFYTFKGTKEGAQNVRCGKVTNTCTIKVSQKYKTPAFWEPGKYYVEVTDIETDKPVRYYFDIIS